jgi:hypothetical protein
VVIVSLAPPCRGSVIDRGLCIDDMVGAAECAWLEWLVALRVLTCACADMVRSQRHIPVSTLAYPRRALPATYRSDGRPCLLSKSDRCGSFITASYGLQRSFPRILRRVDQ